MEFDDGYAMVKTTPPTAILGQPLGTTEVRKRFGVTIVAIKRPGEDFTYATPETVVNRGDVIIASGKPALHTCGGLRPPPINSMRSR
jgi:trk system potassium uptake protein